MTEQNAPRPEEGGQAAPSGTGEGTEYEKPVVRDRRRIDPETGRARTAEEQTRADAAQPAPERSARDAAGDQPGAGPEAGQEGGPVTEQDPEGQDPQADAQQGALAEAKAEAAEAADQLARRNADLYNLQQEYNAYVRRSKTEAAVQRQAGVAEVAEALMGVLDEIELARQHGDLSGPFQAIAEKLETALSQRFGLERYGAVGEEFDPNQHEALMNSTDAEATTTTVSQVLQPGYRMGEKVLRAARVATTSPE